MCVGFKWPTRNTTKHLEAKIVPVGRFEEHNIPRVSTKNISWDPVSKNNI